MATRKISQAKTGSRTRIRQKSSDTLASRTRARLTELADRTDALLGEARESRLAAECDRLEQAAQEHTRLVEATLERLHQVAETLDRAHAERLETERARVREAAETMRERLDAVRSIREATSDLLRANGWTR